ncbi:hypothetical protein BD779DRAFT_1064700 [Infundibulicybe gibba]|nr:hypothetical protein BD779DRAFT_1064700 [Infundibulicybe gibba]
MWLRTAKYIETQLMAFSSSSVVGFLGFFPPGAWSLTSAFKALRYPTNVVRSSLWNSRKVFFVYMALDSVVRPRRLGKSAGTSSKNLVPSSLCKSSMSERSEEFGGDAPPTHSTLSIGSSVIALKYGMEWREWLMRRCILTADVAITYAWKHSREPCMLNAFTNWIINSACLLNPLSGLVILLSDIREPPLRNCSPCLHKGHLGRRIRYVAGVLSNQNMVGSIGIVCQRLELQAPNHCCDFVAPDEEVRECGQGSRLGPLGCVEWRLWIFLVFDIENLL